VVEVLSGNALVVIHKVALRRTRLVPGWATILGRVNHLGAELQRQPPRSTQPGHLFVVGWAANRHTTYWNSSYPWSCSVNRRCLAEDYYTENQRRGTGSGSASEACSLRYHF